VSSAAARSCDTASVLLGARAGPAI